MSCTSKFHALQVDVGHANGVPVMVSGHKKCPVCGRFVPDEGCDNPACGQKKASLAALTQVVLVSMHAQTSIPQLPATGCYPAFWPAGVVKTLQSNGIPPFLAVALLNAPDQVWMYLPRCPYCRAWVSARTGICRNPRCPRHAHQVFLPGKWTWPPVGVSVTKVAKYIPLSYQAWLERAQAFDPTDYDWSTPEAALQSYDRMLREVQELLTLAQGGWATPGTDVYDQETWKEIARRCRLALEQVDDKTLKMLAYKQGFLFPSLIQEHPDKASALVYWLNPAYRPGTAGVVQKKALERWNEAVEAGQWQLVLDQENALRQDLCDAGTEAGVFAPEVWDKYEAFKETKYAQMDALVEQIKAACWNLGGAETTPGQAVEVARLYARYLRLNAETGLTKPTAVYLDTFAPTALEALETLSISFGPLMEAEIDKEFGIAGAGKYCLRSWYPGRWIAIAKASTTPEGAKAMERYVAATDVERVLWEHAKNSADVNEVTAALKATLETQTAWTAVEQIIGYSPGNYQNVPFSAAISVSLPVMREAAVRATGVQALRAASRKEVESWFKCSPYCPGHRYGLLQQIVSNKVQRAAGTAYSLSLLKKTTKYAVVSTDDGIMFITDGPLGAVGHLVRWGRSAPRKKDIVTFENDTVASAVAKMQQAGAQIRCPVCGRFVSPDKMLCSVHHSVASIQAAQGFQHFVYDVPAIIHKTTAVQSSSETGNDAAPVKVSLLPEHEKALASPLLTGYKGAIQEKIQQAVAGKSLTCKDFAALIGTSSGKSYTGKAWVGAVFVDEDGKAYSVTAFGKAGSPPQQVLVKKESSPSSAAVKLGKTVSEKKLGASKYQSVVGLDGFAGNKKCPKCGHPITDYAAYCPKCGHEIGAVEHTPRPGAAPSPIPPTPAPQPSKAKVKPGLGKGWFSQQVQAIAALLKAKSAGGTGMQAGFPRMSGPVSPSEFTFVAQANIGGAHEKFFYQDAQGQQWMFKPDKHLGGTRARTEAAVSELFYRLGLDTPQALVVELQGQTGSIQPMLTGVSGLPPDPTTWSPQQQEQVARLHVGRWLISEHDGNAANNVVTTDGRVVAVDLGQAYRYFGEDQLSEHYHPNGSYTSSEPVHNALWKAVQQNKISLDPQVVAPIIERVEAMPDDDYVALLRPVAEAGSKNVQVGWHARMRQDAAARLAKSVQAVTEEEIADEFLRQALHRKQHIRAHFESFFTALTGKEFKFASKPVRPTPQATGQPVLTAAMAETG